MINYSKQCANSNRTAYNVHQLAMGKRREDGHYQCECGKYVRMVPLSSFGSPLIMIPRHNKPTTKEAK